MDIPQFTDTHCHLTADDFKKDLDQVIHRAVDGGVSKMVTVGSDLESSREAVKLSEKYSSVFAAVGLHPEECTDIVFDEIKEEVSRVRDLAENEKVLAIGEIGIDIRYIDFLARGLSENEKGDTLRPRPAPNGAGLCSGNIEKQKETLNLQLRLALDLNLPVIIHCREAENELFTPLDNFTKNGGRGILHSFTGEPDFLQYFLQSGWFVSFNGIITFKNGGNVRKLCDLSPLESILVETDAPFLAPEPYRGKRCEPLFVIEIAKKAAEIKNVSLEKFGEILDENLYNIFGKKIGCCHCERL